MIAHQNAFGDLYLVIDGRLVKTKSVNRQEFILKLSELRLSVPPDLIKNPPKGVQSKKKEPQSSVVKPQKSTMGKTSKFPEGTVKNGKKLTNGVWVRI